MFCLEFVFITIGGLVVGIRLFCDVVRLNRGWKYVSILDYVADNYSKSKLGKIRAVYFLKLAGF